MKSLRFASSKPLRMLLLIMGVAAVFAAISCGSAKQSSTPGNPATTPTQFLYAWRPTPTTTVDGFRISSNGVLTPVDVVLQTAQSLNLIVADPSGRFVYAATDGSADGATPGAVISFRVQTNSGQLTQAFSAPLPNGAAPLAMAANPAGTLLFVVTALPAGILTYSISPTGQLSLIATASALGLEPLSFAGLAVNPAGTFLYVEGLIPLTPGGCATCGAAGAGISQLAINSTTGALTLVNTVNVGPASEGNAGAQMLFNSAGTVLYLAGQFFSTGIDGQGVEPLTVNMQAGALTATSVQLCGCGAQFGGPIAINGTGTLLFQSTGMPSGIAVYSIKADGSLSALGSSFIPVGVASAPIATAATGSFVYELENGDITEFSVSDSGQKTNLGTATTSGINLVVVVARTP